MSALSVIGNGLGLGGVETGRNCSAHLGTFRRRDEAVDSLIMAGGLSRAY